VEFILEQNEGLRMVFSFLR